MTPDERLSTIALLMEHLQRLRKEIPRTHNGMLCLRMSIRELESDIEHLWHAAA